MPRFLVIVALLAFSGCSIAPFKKGEPESAGGTVARSTGSGPVLTVPTEIAKPVPEEVIEPPVTAPLPKERPRTPPATLSPASRALVSQAEAQRKRGDLPGATVSLERALRMDQQNYAQAESTARKALAMAVGDDRTQALAWQVIGDSLQARGRNPEAQAAYERSKTLVDM